MWPVLKPGNYFALQIIWLVSLWWEFLLKGVSEQTIVSYLVFLKVFQTLMSLGMNVNLWFSFPLWSVTSRKLNAEHLLFIYHSPEIYSEWWLSLQTFCIFSGYIQDLVLRKLCLRLPFLSKFKLKENCFK